MIEDTIIFNGKAIEAPRVNKKRESVESYITYLMAFLEEKEPFKFERPEGITDDVYNSMRDNAYKLYEKELRESTLALYDVMLKEEQKSLSEEKLKKIFDNNKSKKKRGFFSGFTVIDNPKVRDVEPSNDTGDEAKDENDKDKSSDDIMNSTFSFADIKKNERKTAKKAKKQNKRKKSKVGKIFGFVKKVVVGTAKITWEVIKWPVIKIKNAFSGEDFVDNSDIKTSETEVDKDLEEIVLEELDTDAIEKEIAADVENILKEKNAKYLEELNEKDKLIDDYIKRLADNKNEMEKMNAEIINLKHENNELTAKLGELEKDSVNSDILAEKDNLISKLEKEIEVLSSEQRTLQMTNDKLKVENNSLIEKVNKLELIEEQRKEKELKTERRKNNIKIKNDFRNAINIEKTILRDPSFRFGSHNLEISDVESDYIAIDRRKKIDTVRSNVVFNPISLGNAEITLDDEYRRKHEELYTFKGDNGNVFLAKSEFKRLVSIERELAIKIRQLSSSSDISPIYLDEETGVLDVRTFKEETMTYTLKNDIYTITEERYLDLKNKESVWIDLVTYVEGLEAQAEAKQLVK